MAEGSLTFFLLSLVFVWVIVVNAGWLDNYCDYKYKETFTIDEFEVSAGGFASPTLINIKTTDGKQKVIKLRQVYESESGVQEGDMISCKETFSKLYGLCCSSKIKCEKVG